MATAYQTKKKKKLKKLSQKSLALLTSTDEFFAGKNTWVSGSWFIVKNGKEVSADTDDINWYLKEADEAYKLTKACALGGLFSRNNYKRDKSYSEAVLALALTLAELHPKDGALEDAKEMYQYGVDENTIDPAKLSFVDFLEDGINREHYDAEDIVIIFNDSQKTKKKVRNLFQETVVRFS